MFDKSIPSSLLAMQKWFANIIETPLEPDNLLPQNVALDAHSYIAKSHTLSPRERIQIYHQQYWWRLIEVMQENFPSVTRLFGYREFNAKIAVPYLTLYPSQHHTLNELGDKLPLYLEKNYIDEDKQLVLTMAQLDLWSNQSYTKTHTPLQTTNPAEFMTIPLTLQPHVQLFEAPFDFVTFRDNFLKNPPEYYSINPFPELPNKPIYALIYRNHEHSVLWKYVSKEAFTMLSFLQKGTTLVDACGYLENQNVSVGDEIALWLYDWISSQLLKEI